MKTQKLVPIGYIHTNIKSYYLIKDDVDDGYIVVPFGTTPDHKSHQCPRKAVFYCDHIVELTTDIPAVECEIPYDIMDIEHEEIVTTEYKNSIRKGAK